MSTKKRVIPFSGPNRGVLRHRVFNDLKGVVSDSTSYTDWTATYSDLKGYQITDTEAHPGWRDHVNGRFTTDLGGPFSSVKQWAALSSEEPATLSGVIGNGANHTDIDMMSYQGPIMPIAPIFSIISWPSFVNSSTSKLNQLGTDAIARCSPVNPSSDLATSAGEMVSEGLPKAIGGTLMSWRNLSNRQRKRAIGEEYLNYQFGWAPLVNDIRGLCRTVTHVGPIMDQLENNSGKLVRRAYEFPASVTRSSTKVGGLRSPYISPSGTSLYDGVFLNKGQVFCEEIIAKRQWFSGAFTYYVPPRDGSLKTDMARAVLLSRKTLGLTLTPDTVWNLTPWSWLVDWFSNADSVLRNWSNWALFNQVLAYGYVMEHTVHANSYVFTGPLGFQAKGVSVPSLILVSETKKRLRATPYGFGLSWTGLSTIQKAILGALGLARVR
jgi:hypothetical protein